MEFEAQHAIALAQLERRVAQIESHLGLSPPPIETSVSPEVQQIAASGNLIQAIKRHRELTGLGLAEAKADVEALLH
jgi:ribosomal protein L7/L12